IDGKLIGAVAYGWSLTDHKVGMVTPIADMLKLWDLTDKRNASLTEGLNATLPDGFGPMATPLMVSGLGEPAMAMLTTKLKPLQLVPYTVGDAPSGVNLGPLEPGSSVGVQLVRGDVSVGALGTVTYTEGNKALIFGHPFLKKGNVGYFMTNSYIFTTVSGLENSFKVGTTGEAVGLINQDRGAALSGEIGRYPSIIPMLITVEDTGLGRTQQSDVQVVQDQQLSSVLAATTVFNSMDKTMDRVGEGTARVHFEISARGMPGEVLTRDNMFYSPASIGEESVSEFFEAMSLLTGNKYNQVDIMDVKVNVKVEEGRRSAAIIEARANTATAKPGDKVDIALKLKPFRGEPISQNVSFIVPKNQPNGPMTLEVRGGGMIPITQLLLKRQGLDDSMLQINKNQNKPFSDILKEFSERDRNNDVIVEIMDTNVGELGTDSPGATQAKPVMHDKLENEQVPKLENKHTKTEQEITATSDKSLDKQKSRISTDYMIEGDTQVLIQVKNDKK
ncbi:MAG TPA: peptidase S55 SpoIVB, partial [Negativicutes bacterium]